MDLNEDGELYKLFEEASDVPNLEFLNPIRFDQKGDEGPEP
jgi:hypothetical protein